jgi:hypothetical protein
MLDLRLLPTAGVLGVLAGMVALTFACSPAAAPAPTPASDPFAVVRATSQAAYQTGKTFLDRGDLQGCPYIDTAKTTDPDNRSDIQQALDQCLQAIVAQSASTAAAATPLAALSATISPATAGCTPNPAGMGVMILGAPAPAGASSAGVPSATPAASPATAGGSAAVASVVASPQALASGGGTWQDPQGRFSITAPPGWLRIEQPQTRFGTGAVAFYDPSGHAEVDVAVDTAARAISPELYAACAELAMTQQVPGYAAEQAVPATTSGSPAIKRVFTFSARDASGRDVQARGFQTALLKGTTPYIISGAAAASEFQQFSPTFDQVVASFQFS